MLGQVMWQESRARVMQVGEIGSGTTKKVIKNDTTGS